MPGDYLFVYGTLRRGSNNRFAQLLSECAQFQSSGKVPGRLYDFGRHPGARRANQQNELVIGEMFRLESPEELLATLDDYEGQEFERGVVQAYLDDGSTAECWIYWYVGADEGRWIASGDWLRR